MKRQNKYVSSFLFLMGFNSTHPVVLVFHADVCGNDGSFVLFLLGGISVVCTEL